MSKSDIASLDPFTLAESLRQAFELALRAEASARSLLGAPTPPVGLAHQNDLISILRTTCGLLEHALAHRPGAPAPELAQTVIEPATTRPMDLSTASIDSAPTVLIADTQTVVQPASDDQQGADTGNLILPSAPGSSEPAREAESAGSLSETARHLIKLRDKVLMTKSGGEAPSTETLETIYRELGKVLEREGVTPVEDTGHFDHDRQQVIDSQPTTDRTLDGTIAGTVRPGYVFGGRLVRPQEVVVFTFDRAAVAE